MTLNSKQKRHLRALAHPLAPVVIIGDKGLTPEVIRAVVEALEAHELIKVRVAGADRDEVREAGDGLVAGSGAELVQILGKVVTLYKGRAKKPDIQLP